MFSRPKFKCYWETFNLLFPPASTAMTFREYCHHVYPPFRDI
ncbi:hypothetical protein PBCV1_A122/123aR [Paramecium bursaria Chlorella virus 1]|uniref:Uncharacterized protein n=1 Tax=Paramecium bursaria Chlorella virus 1 TaxID=10506 RepID=F8TTY0_PBCV1|nr:hypothetical protein PBCV1_A122/123aR [Paramecium bursaria Chlorella virus 1]AEI70041.1 hypothetical protein [Paramecium bursaria Chlorella virus 1]